MSSVLLALLLTASAVQATSLGLDAAAVAPNLDYRLGPGDVVSIHVTGVREFDLTTRVSNSGRVHVPYVGIMLVVGLTAVEMERDVSELIKKHELVKEPFVRVQIEQQRSRPTYVIGEVNAPGQFIMTGEMYLLDLLSKAGGLLGTASETGFLYRRDSRRPVVETRLRFSAASAPQPAGAPTGEDQAVPQRGWIDSPDGPSEQVLAINFEHLRDGTKPELNVRVQGGDILYVPRVRAENIYIIGDVKVPGAYTLPRRGTITAAQAIIYAGGPMPTAGMRNGFLMRHDEGGVRSATPVDFAAIIDGRRPDIPVRPNDIIFIPSSNIKTVGVGLLNLLPRLLQQFLIF